MRRPTSIPWRLPRQADRLGFELLVPVGRWRGFGGSTDFNGTCMETYTWAAALAAQTEHIMLFSTSHAPTIHPIVAAKQGRRLTISPTGAGV